MAGVVENNDFLSRRIDSRRPMWHFFMSTLRATLLRQSLLGVMPLILEMDTCYFVAEKSLLSPQVQSGSLRNREQLWLVEWSNRLHFRIKAIGGYRGQTRGQTTEAQNVITSLPRR